MPIDEEKLAKLQKLSNANKVGGIRRKQVKKAPGSAKADDTKLQATLAKFNAQRVDNVVEANFFRNDGKIMHFNRVGVQTCPQHNVTGFYGIPQEKQLTELLPSIIPQLGQEDIEMFRQIAAQLQQAQANQANAEGAEKKDEQIPDLVEGQTFDDVE